MHIEFSERKDSMFYIFKEITVINKIIITKPCTTIDKIQLYYAKKEKLKTKSYMCVYIYM